MNTNVIFVWSNFGPYHIDRLNAAANALAPNYQVVGIEIASSTEVYPWSKVKSANNIKRITLFPDRSYESVYRLQQFFELARTCVCTGARHVFLCHYDRIEIFCLAVLLRFLGRRVYLMLASKFDDKRRYIWRELAKKIFYFPYCGALAGGTRTRDYLRMFGIPLESTELGYDTVSINRMKELSRPKTGGDHDFRQRYFLIVARLVPKKNIAVALDAYALYCNEVGSLARELHICGSGILENELKEKVISLGLTNVHFHGFMQIEEIAVMLASSLALILPSTEEQWGLVINEALALGIPVLYSQVVGAHDLLVRNGVNGYSFEPDNPIGLSGLMRFLASDENEWKELVEGARKMAPLGDSERFGDSVARLVRGRSSPSGPTIDQALKSTVWIDG